MGNRERNVALSIVFTILTCGIYGWYWMVVLNDDMLDALNEDGTSGGLVLVLSLVTCGIYGLYWMYQTGRRVDRLNARYGRHTDNSGLLYLIIGILGLSIVVYGVAQNELNQYYRNFPPYYDYQ
ncbi:MAG TPA: DUF4234 domain-containing protein [Candidatus Blautia gallistercoris]|uniref:DUF4234 domain-containing protein n=1 Tax=Candidatus Blautia gallistercoris TaxID=2838490 RepID=A0A9D1WFV0_9FIRM|nr:DUF4234 domain-containing protein [Candidatus Blautia gallistercoris]